VRRVVTEAFASPRIVSRGILHVADDLSGFVSEEAGKPVGLLLYQMGAGECEVVVLLSLQERKNIATALIAEAEQAARAAGCRRLWLVTTNDNLPAIAFYAKRGWRQVAVHRGAVTEARRLKPEIPEFGAHGVPKQDEIEFELRLAARRRTTACSRRADARLMPALGARGDMTRRVFVCAVGINLIAVPLRLAAQQPQRIPRVGYLFSFSAGEGRHLWEACRRGLRELGYVEAQNILFEPRWAEGHHERLPELAAELVRLKVNVIVAAATPATRAAKAATDSIPIVMVAVGEPIKTGLVTNFSRPGGNVTGLSLLTPELSGKRLELLAVAMRNISRLAVLMNSDNPVHAVFLEETRVAAQRSGARLQLLEARDPREIEQAFSAAGGERAAALIVFDDPVLWSYRKQIVALAAKQRLPVIYGYREFVDDGGLMSYGPDRIDHYRRSASYVAKILQGAKPGSLPIEQPTKFELVINLKTAKALGLTIPESLLLRADQVIQ